LYLCFVHEAKSCWLGFFFPFLETLQSKEEDEVTEAGKEGD
jgi:hypothetical protein